MSAYNFNPDVCLQVLYGVAEEIPSGVSDKHWKLSVPVRDTVITKLKQLIDWLWRNYQIPKKLKHLEELEKKAGNCDTWRPTTGKVNLNPTIAKNLLKRKAELIKQIELVRTESAMLLPYIKITSEQSKQQLEEIKTIEQKILFAYKVRT